MNIAGIDYSLRGPAVCVFAGDYETEFCFSKCNFFFLTEVKKYVKSWNLNIHGESFQKYNEEFERYETIADWAMDKVSGCDQIALEGYSFGSKGSRVFQIAENTGMLKYKIYRAGIPLSVYPPSTIKKFATDKGNANKNKMYESFARETDSRIQSLISPDKDNISNPVSDIVDSYYVCKYLHEQIMNNQRS